MQEKRLISKFFDEISQDSGKHTSGVKVMPSPKALGPCPAGMVSATVH